MGTIWKGHISFGLVNIPVRVESATRDTTPKFRMLHGRDNSPVKTIRVRQGDGERVEYKELTKGYECEAGHCVILDDEDFRQVALQTTRTIDIMDFVDESEIDARYFEKPHFLEVQRGGEKAYALLRKAIRETGRVAEAKVVFQRCEHLAAVKVVGDVLVLDLMRFDDELVPLSEVETPAEEGLSEKEVGMALQLVAQSQPDLTTVERVVSKRGPRVYLDFLQNRRGATVASAYSVRPRPGATVSAPLSWAELERDLQPADFDLRSMRERLEAVGDLWIACRTDANDVREVLELL